MTSYSSQQNHSSWIHHNKSSNSIIWFNGFTVKETQETKASTVKLIKNRAMETIQYLFTWTYKCYL